MKRIIFAALVVCPAAFLTIKLLPILNIQLPQWIMFYGSNLLCMPIVLTICLIAVQRIKGDRNLKLPLLPILSLALFYSFFFEVYLPPNHSRYTSDPLDVLMYFIGALIFYLLQRSCFSEKRTE